MDGVNTRLRNIMAQHVPCSADYPDLEAYVVKHKASCVSERVHYEGHELDYCTSDWKLKDGSQIVVKVLSNKRGWFFVT